MERFCGHLLPAVKNRIRPYEHLSNYVQRRAQMQIVSRIHGLPSLAKPTVNYTYHNGEKISSRERIYPLCKSNFIVIYKRKSICSQTVHMHTVPQIILGTPINRTVPITTQLMNQLTKFFGPLYPQFWRQLRERIAPDSLVRYGRFRLADDGDRIRTAALIDGDPIARDNSFVRVSH
jgi:hypothetical protein